MRKLSLKSFWLVLALLCTSFVTHAMTPEDFFWRVPDAIIQVTNDSNYPWAVNDAGQLHSTNKDYPSVSVIKYTNSSDEAINVSFAWRACCSAYDKFGWSLDGNNYTELGSSQTFVTVSEVIPAKGSIYFRFNKLRNIWQNDDCGYVKDLKFGYVSGSHTESNGSIWGYTFNRNGTAVELTSYTGNETEPAISSIEYKGKRYPIESIANNLFKGNTNLTSVSFPEGLKSVGSNAFEGCSNLNNVVLPSTVTNIYDRAFANCTGLTNITLSRSLEEVSGSAFDGTSELQSYTIPADNASYTSVDGVLYKKDMTDIVFFPKGKTGSYSLPTTMTVIRNNVFSGARIKNVVIPSTIESIGASAFKDCSMLTEITVPASVKTIAENAFNASHIYKIILQSDEPVALSATNSFYGDAFFFVPDAKLDDYKTASIWSDMSNRIYAQSNEFTEVTNYAENGKIKLAEAVGVGNEQNVFNLKVHGTVNGWDIMVIQNKMKNLCNLDLSDATIVADEGYKYYGSYVAQNDVLGPYSFYQMYNLRTIALPKNITAIGDNAFSGCTNLLTVSNMPATCKSIGKEVFMLLTNLREITIGEGVETIGKDAFYGCSSLKSITIPSSVKYISEEAFIGCSGLKELNFSEGLETIGIKAFSNCLSLKTIEFPNTLSLIDQYAFDGCRGLKTVNFQGGLKIIAAYAFRRCTSITDLKLPPQLERINSYAFNGCTSLKEVHVPSMMQYIGNYAFTDCGVEDVYAYTLTPVAINANTFNYNAVLHAPNNPYDVFLAYYSNNGWRKFLDVVPFDAKYESWYLGEDQDITLRDDETIQNEDGKPSDGEMRPGSGIIYRPGFGLQNPIFGVKKFLLKTVDSKSPSFIDNGNVSVNELTFNLNVQANKWYFYSFPFDIDLSNAKYQGKFVWRYYDGNERASNGQGGWKNVVADEQGKMILHAHQGYIFQTNKSGEVELTVSDPVFTGSDKNVVITSHPSDNAQDASWNLVGNPNISYYDLNNFLEDFNRPITVWNPKNNTYEAVMPGDDDYVFHPFEAFFVQKPTDMGAIKFESEKRETYLQSQKTMEARKRSRAAQQINESRRLVNISISNGTQSDKTRVVFNDEKSMGYEQDCDASKFLSDQSTAQIYTLDQKGNKYAINERPNGDNTVALGFTALTEGTYTISAQRMDMQMALKDMQTGTIHNFADGEYEFMSKAGTFNDRFYLVPAADASGINSLASLGVSVFANNSGISINGLNGKTATIYNAAGATVATLSENGYTPATAGTYIVTVGDKSSKIVVK